MINDNLTASERLKYFKFSSSWELLSPDNGGVGGGGVPVGGGGRWENNSLFIWFIGISCFTYHPALWAPLLQLKEGNGDSPRIGSPDFD